MVGNIHEKNCGKKFSSYRATDENILMSKIFCCSFLFLNYSYPSILRYYLITTCRLLVLPLAACAALI